ncbi:DMT family transporter [Abyssibius alkaniclasticus]|uniref:DMT family transporter n=1 Tax=Abyssibius alkaniclasticus TaxID=2881234 RepID=UPI00236380CE|nr:DMT family transporter [Abyssibius alkaniclasticus]UPH71104.1 DMT family transporter [Abyssibius alkaniclasticus]
MNTPRPSSWVILALVGLVWGTSFPVMRVALQDQTPLNVAALRIAFAAVVIWGIARARGLRLPGFQGVDRRIWLASFGMAVLSNALPFSLLLFSLAYVSAGFAGITMALVPLLVLPLGHVLLPDQPMTGRRALGFTIGFIGVVVLIGPGVFSPGAGGWTEVIAQLGCILAALCYALGSIVTRRAPPGPTLVFSSAALLLAALIMLPVAFIVEGAPQMATPLSWATVAYLGLVPTALATLMLVFLIKREGPAFLALANYQVPIWAVVLGVVFLDETLPSRFMAALVLVLAGLAISQAKIGRARV